MRVSVGRSAQPRRVFLHVGSPKTGTTFLQNVLWSQRETAAAQGVRLPLGRFSDHYLASLDIRGLAGRSEHPPAAVGSWKRLVREAESAPGTALVSHELFAAATAEQAAAAVASFGPGTEVHVVLTARDLVRQIPAEWQEHVKHRSSTTMPDFVDELRSDTRGRSWFWRVQDFADVVARWGATLPPDHVHVVTVPPADGDPGLLWERFCSLLGLDAGSFDTQRSRANTSLGVEQAELLRRMNAELGDRLRLPGPYPVVAKNVLAHRVLAARPGTRLRLDADATAFAVERSAQIAHRLADAGYDVVGDLDELVPGPGPGGPAPTEVAAQQPSEQALLEEGVAAVIGLLETMAVDRARLRRLEDRLAQPPVRLALLQASERHPLLMKGRRLYRRVTARVSDLRTRD